MISHAMLYGRLLQLFGVENSLVDYRFDFFFQFEVPSVQVNSCLFYDLKIECRSSLI
jgi:hypothetical protein